MTSPIIGAAGEPRERATRDTIDDTLDWLEERKANCVRLASRKSGTDRDGWIDDGAHFGHAISLIRRAYRARGTTSPPASPEESPVSEPQEPR